MNKQTIQLREPHNRLLSAYTTQLQRERYSRQTVRNYTNHFIKFLQYCDDKLPADLSNEEVNAFIMSAGKKRSLSNSSVTVLSYSIRYYYEKILRSPKHTLTFKLKVKS